MRAPAAARSRSPPPSPDSRKALLALSTSSAPNLAENPASGGRSEFWTHGRSWTGAPGSVIVFEPGDVHRDLKREGPVTYQLIGFSTPFIDALGVQSCLAVDDARGLPFQRIHDAVASGADRFCGFRKL